MADEIIMRNFLQNYDRVFGVDLSGEENDDTQAFFANNMYKLIMHLITDVPVENLSFEKKRAVAFVTSEKIRKTLR